MTEQTETAPPGYLVMQEKCFRCATCSSLAPEVFAMERDSARVLRQPRTPAERAASEAARITCPGSAIGFRGPGKGLDVGMDMRSPGEALSGSAAPPIAGKALAPLFPRLFDEAERVRWRMTDVPWGAIEQGRVTPGLVRFVREMALSELTTFSATRRFLSEMADDVDFSSWAAVWFYEETKHPEALFRWLSAFDVTVPSSAVQRGRVSAPFMRSRTGTLVMNVLSEMFASAGYQNIERHTKEPVLARIARNLAGDEARHGAAFYVFSERAILSAKSPDFERLQAIKVLYYWVQAADHVEHPVSQFHEKVSADPELREVMDDIGTDYAPILSRACRLIGTLIGRRLEAPEDVLPALREMSGGRD